MTNFVFTAIQIILTTNVMDEAPDTLRGDVKFCTNVITESHAYEVGGRQWFHVMPPTTNVVRMELKWVEAPLKAEAMKPEPQPISQAKCVTRIYDARLYTEDGSNVVSNSLMAKGDGAPASPPLHRRRIDWESGKPLTRDEADSLCLPPLPGYVQAMTKPKQ